MYIYIWASLEYNRFTCNVIKLSQTNNFTYTQICWMFRYKRVLLMETHDTDFAEINFFSCKLALLIIWWKCMWYVFFTILKICTIHYIFCYLEHVCGNNLFFNIVCIMWSFRCINIFRLCVLRWLFEAYAAFFELVRNVFSI